MGDNNIIHGASPKGDPLFYKDTNQETSPLGESARGTLVWDSHKYNTTWSLKHERFVKGEVF